MAEKIISASIYFLRRSEKERMFKSRRDVDYIRECDWSEFVDVGGLLFGPKLSVRIIATTIEFLIFCDNDSMESATEDLFYLSESILWVIKAFEII